MKKKTWECLLFLFIVGATALFISYFTFDAYISHSNTLAAELRSPANAIYLWEIDNHPPFKYRLLFSKIVKATWALFRSGPQDNTTFLYIYRSWSIFFFFSAFISFFYFLKALKFKQQEALAGTILYILLPSIFLAFSFPVHTREDLLAYTLLHLGLITLVRRQIIAFLLICCLSVFCRETLLILPLIYFLYYPAPIITKMLMAALPCSLWVGVRWAVGYEYYDVLGLGLYDNLENLFLTVTFSYLTFGILWYTFIYNKINACGDKNIITRSSWVVTALVILTTFLLGRVIEIRLLHLMAPWVLVESLYFFKRRRRILQHYWHSKTFINPLIISLLGLSAVYISVYYIKLDKFKMIGTYWWGYLFASLIVTVTGLHFFYKTRSVESATS